MYHILNMCEYIECTIYMHLFEQSSLMVDHLCKNFFFREEMFSLISIKSGLRLDFKDLRLRMTYRDVTHLVWQFLCSGVIVHMYVYTCFTFDRFYGPRVSFYTEYDKGIKGKRCCVTNWTNYKAKRDSKQFDVFTVIICS